MKYSLFVLIVLTYTYESLGQTTPGFTIPEPTTDCGKRVFQCYTQQKATFDQADSDFDFSRGCRAFRTYLGCYYRVYNSRRCTNVTEVTAINDMVVEDRGGICNFNGSVTDCGLSVQGCIADVVQIKNDYASLNVSTACPAISKLMECVDSATILNSCTNKIKMNLITLMQSFAADALTMGCDGRCGRLVGNCARNITETIVNADYTTINWNNFCGTAFTAIGCINNLTANIANNCSSASVKSMAADQLTLLSGYCAAPFQPSACIVGVQACTAAWNSAIQNAPAAQVCSAAATYQECAANVAACPGAGMTDMLGRLRESIETDQTKGLCPTRGSCSDRLQSCADSWRVSFNWTIMGSRSQITQHCNEINTGRQCFSSVRTDPMCIKENLNQTMFENFINGRLGRQCSGVVTSSSTQVLFSWILLTLALVISASRLQGITRN